MSRAGTSGGRLLEVRHLLVTHPATDSGPLYLPDGTQLAFVSTSTGGGNIYVMTLATGELTRLTYSYRLNALDGWSHDGKWIYFSSSIDDIAGQGDIFRVSATSGTPLEVSHERYLTSLRVLRRRMEKDCAGGEGDQQHAMVEDGHAHIDETEVSLKPVAESGKYERLLEAGAKQCGPMWSVD